MSGFDITDIKKHWEENIFRHGASPDSSWGDSHAIELEIRTLSKYLKDGETVLDAGCNNGFSTLRYAQEKSVRIFGIDYVEQMIEVARERLKKVSLSLSGTATFELGDITSLSKPENSFDKVIATRTIINLGEWEKQKKGLAECSRVLKTNGHLLLSEATRQGWERLNRFRNNWSLPEIPMPSFNNYLDEAKLLGEMPCTMELIESRDFSSTYYLGTRVIKPLFIKALGMNADAANAQMEWNRWFSKLPSWGGYGVQKLFVFRKRPA